jgi:hypothetical protein
MFQLKEHYGTLALFWNIALYTIPAPPRKINPHHVYTFGTLAHSWCHTIQPTLQ